MTKLQIERKKERERARKNRKQRRLLFLSYLGGKCKKCKSKKNLQVDHINPLKKKFTLSGSNWSKPLNILYKELDKCQLLCRKCHQKKTNKDRQKGKICYGSR